MNKRLFLIGTLLFAALLLGALPAMAQEPVVVTWFVGLGAGGQPQQIDAQNAVVEAFNAAHDDIELQIVIANNDVAIDTLSTLIAAGDGPDIVGPVGIEGSNAFDGSWLDLEPLVESSGYDLTQFPQSLVDFYRVEGQGLIGLPFGVFPSFIYFDRDLFDEAGLDYPPQVYGEPYADGDVWDFDKVRELGLLLTVDANGNDATSPDFDPQAVEQWGFVAQWTEPRGQATMFGPGSFVDADGNATIPDHWRDFFHWYYEGMWTDYFIPNGVWQGSDLLGPGNPFNSGRVAMAQSHLWYTCCLTEVANWDIAVMPSYNGQTTAKLHADTFRILNSTENPEAAFEVLSYLIGESAPALLQVYGGLPARPEEQEAFFATLDETFTQGVNWQVAIDSLNYPDNPNHQANMPSFNVATSRIGAFQTLYEGTEGLDIDAELDLLQADLQAIFDGTYVAPPTATPSA